MKVRVWALGLLLGALLGCGRQVAQTAERGPSADASLEDAPDAVDASDGSDASDAPEAASAPECVSDSGGLALPNDDLFGDGGEPPSLLVQQAYAAGQGPGIYVAARDAYRVYLNGELVTASQAPRQGEFVGLSVLPGDNVLTLVVAAQHGTPAALVQLDELERSYFSDATWRVSTAPAAGFQSPDFDDSSWEFATDYGALGELPGCDPSGLFPSDTRARWIGPAPGLGSSMVLRTHVRIAPVGFGAGVTGGAGAAPVFASSWDELRTLGEDSETPMVIVLSEGVHDFRPQGADIVQQTVCPSSCPNDASHTLYTVLLGTATCPVPMVTRPRNDRILNIGSNKTLVGLGRGAALRGLTIEFGSSHNVIARNLAIYDINPDLIEAGDAFGFTQSDGVWVDHCTTKWISDGFSDARLGAKNISISWVHYDGTSPEACDGQHPRASQISDAIVTFHHTFFDHVTSHSPLADHPTARVHLFDNLLTDDPDSAVQSACGAQVLMEANVFERVAHPTQLRTCSDDPSLGLIDAPAGSNLYRSDTGTHLGGDGGEPHDAVFAPPYSYVLDPAASAWPDVIARAGAGGPWAQLLVRD